MKLLFQFYQNENNKLIFTNKFLLLDIHSKRVFPIGFLFFERKSVYMHWSTDITTLTAIIIDLFGRCYLRTEESAGFTRFYRWIIVWN